jgi:hypothetical protein
MLKELRKGYPDLQPLQTLIHKLEDFNRLPVSVLFLRLIDDSFDDLAEIHAAMET